MGKYRFDKTVPASDFFDHKDENFWKEVSIDALLVDIASEFINYRADHQLSQKDLAEKLDISQGYLYQRMKKIAPEKIRHRTSKRDIIENVFDGDEKLYAASRFLERKKRKYAKSVRKEHS